MSDMASNDETETGSANPYTRALGARLRAVRTQQKLSLQGVEQKSGGRWKAVVVGSYERGDRAVTVAKLAELADFYGVPIVELLGGGRIGREAEPTEKLVLNLDALKHVDDERARPLLRYAASIQSRRGDYNGKVLSIRHDDLRALAAIYDESPSAIIEHLIDWGVLGPNARHAAV